MPAFVRISSPLLLLAVVACSGGTASIDDPTAPSPSPGADEGAGSDPAAPPGDDEGAPNVGGPVVTVAARGVSTPFAHQDGLSGRTPGQQIVAVRSLHLLRAADDAAPVEVFDLGEDSVEVDYATGDTVGIATVPVASLPGGAFTRAKVGVAYVRYRVPARMHTTLGSYDGHYQNVQAMSDGAKVDGKPRKKGWFRYAFALGGNETGALEGDDAPVPELPTTGDVTLDTSGPVTFYVFPIQLVIDPDVGNDVLALFEANVFESFRWADEARQGYTPGVFDTTPVSYEPVMAFGANSFTMTYTTK